MFKAVGSDMCKPTAASVEKYTDRTILFDGSSSDIDLDDIELIDGEWAYKMRATAIIMAGGKSKRMGQDKSVLLINGTPAIKHIFAQLRSHFDQIIVSSNNITEHSFDGVEIVPDEATGKGPLMGIASALRVSRNEINFVIACDIPEVDIDIVRQMLRESNGFDAVVPQTGPSQYEPLFAVYKKSVLAEIDKSIAAGQYKIVEPLKNCKINYVDLPGDVRLENLNTMNDYREFVEKR
jgi:molybdopterin-guanine dinucleotide biosynthesis protein A